jgi:hypothetical protein
MEAVLVSAERANGEHAAEAAMQFSFSALLQTWVAATLAVSDQQAKEGLEVLVPGSWLDRTWEVVLPGHWRRA